jgi:hypothetical protein
MKISLLERKLLRFIDKHYPIAWDRLDEKEIIAVGERQLPSLGDISRSFDKNQPAEISNALKSLIGYQYVAEVYLRSREDYEEVTIAAGKKLRMLSSAKGTGVDALQITSIGKSAIESFWDSKLWRLLYSGDYSQNGRRRSRKNTYH